MTLSKIKQPPRLRNLDELFQLNQEDSIIENNQNNSNPNRRFQAIVNLDMLSSFAAHPFRLYEGERLDDMVNSIKTNGVLVPIILREKEDKLEILAGHNRVNASKLAGLSDIPAIILRNITDEEALMYVIETNWIGYNKVDSFSKELI